MLLTIADVLEITGLSRRTFFRYREAYDFGEVRVNDHNVLFRAEAVERWALEQTGQKIFIGRESAAA